MEALYEKEEQESQNFMALYISHWDVHIHCRYE